MCVCVCTVCSVHVDVCMLVRVYSTMYVQPGVDLIGHFQIGRVVFWYPPSDKYISSLCGEPCESLAVPLYTGIMLKENINSLKKLDLRECGLQPEGLEQVIKGVQVNTTLESLWLSENTIDNKSASSLGKSSCLLCIYPTASILSTEAVVTIATLCGLCITLGVWLL